MGAWTIWRERFARLFQRLWQRSAVRAAATVAVVLTALTIVLFWLMNYYAKTLEQNRRWVESVHIGQTSALPGVIFQRLLDAQLIWVERDSHSVQIRYVSCENSMQRIDGDLPPNVDPGAVRDLLQLLCVAPQGEAIRQEIDQWNRSFLLLAVRDNRDVNPSRPAASGPAIRPRMQTAASSTTPGATPAANTRVCRDRALTPVSRLVGMGCFPSEWHAEFMRGDAPVATPAQENAVVPYRDFAFVAAAGTVWAGDWFVASLLEGGTASAAPNPGGAGEFYRLKTSLPLGSEGVTIELVGRARRVSIDGRQFEVHPERLTADATKAVSLSPYKLEIDFYCDDNREDEAKDRCEKLPGLEETVPYAFWFEVNGPAGKAVAVEIDADPIRVFPSELLAQKRSSGLRARARRGAAAKTNRPVRLQRTPHLEVTCNREWVAPLPGAASRDGRQSSGCGLGWVTSNVVERTAARASYRLLARDGKTELITPASGTITEGAVEAGLAPIVGLAPQDVGSLVAVLDALPRREPQDYRLTIHMDMQKLSQQVLDRQAPCRGVKSTQQFKQARRSGGDCSDHLDKLHASVVLMDASDDPVTRGEILAIASWPSIAAGLPAWDLAALEIGAPSRSPLTGMAWRAVDISATPGSSFKVVAGLAAIEAALNGDNTLLELLRGNRTLSQAAGDLKIAARIDAVVEATPKRAGACRYDERPRDPGAFNALPIPNHSGTNYFCAGNSGEGQGAPFSRLFLSPKDSGCMGPNARTDRRGGLCESLITSSNLFFGGLALYLDGKRVVRSMGGREIERDEALPDLAMARAARRLFPDAFPAPRLPVNSPAKQNETGAPAAALAFDLLRGQIDRNVTRLFASPMVVKAATAAGPDEARRVALGVSGYGQAVSASALAMATAYAGVGSRYVVRPRLVPREPSRPERVLDEQEGQRLLASVPPGREQLAEELMTLLRRGLAGVISSPSGTGHAAFRRSPLLRPLGSEIIFAKTGTATIGWSCRPFRGAAATRRCGAGTRELNVYSSWLAGWIEPPGVPSGIDRRIAFACSVSYTFAFGADACAPIVGDILQQLHAKPVRP